MIEIPLLDDISVHLGRRAEREHARLDASPFTYLVLAIGNFVSTARAADVEVESPLVGAFAERTRELFATERRHDETVQVLLSSLRTTAPRAGEGGVGADLPQPLASALVGPVVGLDEEALGYLTLSGLAALEAVRDRHDEAIANRFVSLYLSIGMEGFRPRRRDEVRASIERQEAAGDPVRVDEAETSTNLSDPSFGPFPRGRRVRRH